MGMQVTQSWNTKYGLRRVRNEAPTLAEAVAAAQGLSNEIDEQAEIASLLIGLPIDQVRAELLKVETRGIGVVRSVLFAGPASAPRTVLVERKRARRSVLLMERADRPKDLPIKAVANRVLAS